RHRPWRLCGLGAPRVLLSSRLTRASVRIAEFAYLRRSPTPNTLLEEPMRETTPLAPSDPVKSGSTLPVYLTPEQVATMLQIDERTVLRWAQQDTSLPATRIGRVIRFEREPL